MKTKTPFRREAFTLVEIMVALVIFSMVVGAIYSTWVLILKSSRVGRETADQIQRQRITVRTIEDSLTCIQSFQASMKYYSFVVQNGDQPMLSFVAQLPAMFPRNDRFGDFHLRRLTFTVESDADAERNLVLRQNPILLPVDSDEQAFPLVLARDVQSFAIECLDTNRGKWVTEWDDTNSIPPQVRYSLVTGGNGTGWAVTNVVTLQSVTMPKAVQTGSPGGQQ